MRARDFIIRPNASWDATWRELDGLLRDVRFILNGGIAVRDQFRVVRDAIIDTEDLPLSLSVQEPNRAIGIILLRATARPNATGRVLSGGHVEWDASMAGTIRIHACSALAADTRYDATFAVVE